jgi:putative Mn2+ efflux pump MntP
LRVSLSKITAIVDNAILMSFDLHLVIAVALGLAMDAFAVSIASSVMLGTVNSRQVFRFAWHFGFFQAAMFLAGWLGGRIIADLIRSWDHWVAFILLTFIGLRAIASTFGENDRHRDFDPTRGWSLVLLSVATSIDALAAGISFAAIGTGAVSAGLIVGITAALLSAVGMIWGARIGTIFGRHLERAGGLVLILIGVKVLVDHLLAG